MRRRPGDRHAAGALAAARPGGRLRGHCRLGGCAAPRAPRRLEEPPRARDLARVRWACGGGRELPRSPANGAPRRSAASAFSGSGSSPKAGRRPPGPPTTTCCSASCAPWATPTDSASARGTRPPGSPGRGRPCSTPPGLVVGSRLISIFPGGKCHGQSPFFQPVPLRVRRRRVRRRASQWSAPGDGGVTGGRRRRRHCRHRR